MAGRASLRWAMAGLLLAAAGGIGAWAWWLYGEDPEVNSVLGPQPGELTPSRTDGTDVAS